MVSWAPGRDIKLRTTGGGEEYLILLSYCSFKSQLSISSPSSNWHPNSLADCSGICMCVAICLDIRKGKLHGLSHFLRYTHMHTRHSAVVTLGFTP